MPAIPFNMDKNYFLNGAKSREERLLAARMLDLADAAQRQYRAQYSQFLNGHELVLAQRVLAQTGVCFDLCGGYEEAERKIVCCYPEYAAPQPEELPVRVISVAGRDVAGLSHRDYLGALLGLGLKREKLGDIIVTPQGGFIICMADIADYIVNQLSKIGSRGVRLSVSNFDEIEVPAKNYKEIRTTCSSLRLDSVLSSGAGLSRGEGAALIAAGKVSVNWECRQKPDDQLQEGDLLSVQGIGRLRLFEVGGETRKGRRSIVIHRYI